MLTRILQYFCRPAAWPVSSHIHIRIYIHIHIHIRIRSYVRIQMQLQTHFRAYQFPTSKQPLRNPFLSHDLLYLYKPRRDRSATRPVSLAHRTHEYCTLTDQTPCPRQLTRISIHTQPANQLLYNTSSTAQRQHKSTKRKSHLKKTKTHARVIPLIIYSCSISDSYSPNPRPEIFLLFHLLFPADLDMTYSVVLARPHELKTT